MKSEIKIRNYRINKLSISLSMTKTERFKNRAGLSLLVWLIRNNSFLCQYFGFVTWSGHMLFVPQVFLYLSQDVYQVTGAMNTLRGRKRILR